MVTVGEPLKSFEIESVNPASMKIWAQILRDPNPIHLDPEAVRAKGLGDRVINQGPANLSYVVNAIHSTFPSSRLESLNVRYVDNVFSGEAVAAGGRIVEVNTTDSTLKVTCDVWLHANGSRPVISGTAVVCISVTN